MEQLPQTDAEWRKKLTPEEYHVLREKGTEPAFTGMYWDYKEDGYYHCAGCGQPLFNSVEKFDSGTGWPSFTQPIDHQKIDYEEDKSLPKARVEVMCSRCKSHLGHVFKDGPKPTGLRYCLNSKSLKFIPERNKDV